jgi:single-strand DNA-binding protein
MINCTIVGNVGSDPVLKYTDAGKAVCSFSLASSRKYKTNGELVTETTWFRVSCWEGRAEVVAQYVKKGHKVAVVTNGIKGRAYKKDSGDCEVSLDITASEVTFLERKGESLEDDSDETPDF